MVLQAAAANQSAVLDWILALEQQQQTQQDLSRRSSAKPAAASASSAAPNRWGTTPLMAAAGVGAVAALRTLLASGFHRARIHDSDRSGRTALHLAAAASRECVRATRAPRGRGQAPNARARSVRRRRRRDVDSAQA